MSFLRDTQTINLGGELLDIVNLDRSGLGRDVIFLSHAPMITDKLDGADMRHLQPSIIIWDEAHQFDRALKAHLGPHAEFTENCRPYFEETMRGSDMYKMTMDIESKHYYQAPAHKPGETPRGTKPSFIGGIKKTKQQRAAMKARRKQR